MVPRGLDGRSAGSISDANLELARSRTQDEWPGSKGARQAGATQGTLWNRLLRILASRPTAHGLEMHLVSMHKAVNQFAPDVVVVDPIANLINVGNTPEIQSMMTRLIDFLKLRGTTTFFTSLTRCGSDLEQSEVGISSLIDTWLMLQIVRSGGERNRTLTIIKSRGMAHSNQAVEYRLSDDGLELVDTYVSAAGVLTGSARLAKEAEDEAALAAGAEEIARKEEERKRRQQSLQRQIAELREQFQAEDAALERNIQEAIRRRDGLAAERASMAESRQAFTPSRKKTADRRARERTRFKGGWCAEKGKAGAKATAKPGREGNPRG
jgi:circadian clock protein KaiC